jgi:hypothetical protein
MRILSSAIVLVACAACHGSSDMAGVYVGMDRSGTFFPCDSANVALMVPDSALAARYQTLVASPGEPVFVRLRGVKRRSGSIYDGRRWFQVQQVVELRARGRGECPRVAHSASTVLPS